MLGWFITLSCLYGLLLLVLFIKLGAITTENQGSAVRFIELEDGVKWAKQDLRILFRHLLVNDAKAEDGRYGREGRYERTSLELLTRRIDESRGDFYNEINRVRVVTLPSGKVVSTQEALELITDYLGLEVEVTPPTCETKKLIKKTKETK
jgi:hypothetical protein